MPKKCRARKPKAPLDVSLLWCSKRLTRRDGFKEGEFVEPAAGHEDADMAEDAADDSLALVLISTIAQAIQIVGTSSLPVGSTAVAPHLPVDLMQAIATNFRNMLATSVTREVLEAGDVSPNV